MAYTHGDENVFGSCNPLHLEDHFLYFSHLNEDDDDDYIYDAQMPCKRAKRELKEISKLPPPLWLRLTITPKVIEEKLNGADDEAARTLQAPNNKVEKLKAVHLPICSLKIGFYLIEAQYPAHLVAKFYFAKRKLVWEILNKGLKHKIEIQWHNISAIRACIDEENKPGILEIELERVPSFYRETKPQPRKHTVWTSSPDFTESYCASQYRRHFLRFPPGVLDQHYHKLLRLDNRLLELSCEPFPSFESSYFDSYLDDEGTTTHIHFGHHDLQSHRSRTTPSSEQPVILDPPPISTQAPKLNANTMPFSFGAINNLTSLSSAFEQQQYQQQPAFDLSVFLTQQVQPYDTAIKDPTSLSSFDLPVISTQQVRLYKDMMMPFSDSDINDPTSLSSGICSPTNETINNQLLQDRWLATCNPEHYYETIISSSSLCLLPTT